MGTNDFGFEWEFSPENEGGTFLYSLEQSIMYEQEILQTPPPVYQLVLLNDDETPVDFVTFILQSVFNKNFEAAEQLTLTIHDHDKAVCGTFTRDVAETKIMKINELCKEYNYPLQCVMQRERVDAIKKS